MTLNELLPQIKPLWTLWFFTMFAVIIVWTMWPRRRGDLEAQARIPLEEDNPANGGRDGR
ncbi:MAG: cbb3-type cytochrome c oxidase subunit 3 [Rhodospirillales bacterium]|nr:cbb3-type cytochrome c oxidase subunit 3 [Rhodospirillales bacterium]QQS13021.1 MAG: cbb3-type cytochrome c oxidase subunit 3 [Rhodospirillales bacterium]